MGWKLKLPGDPGSSARVPFKPPNYLPTDYSGPGRFASNTLPMTTKTTTPGTKELYFGYGSNLWVDQMTRRCPESKLIGFGILQGWKWFIHTNGYANIVRSPEDIVYGLIYEISPSDETSLDDIEEDYTKETIEFELRLADNGERSFIQGLVYIDEMRVQEGEPREEYVHRINMGINDASARGLPSWYIDKYMRKFIPAEGREEAVEAFRPEEDLHRIATDTKPEV